MGRLDEEGAWPELPNHLLFLNGSRAGSAVRIGIGRLFLDLNGVRETLPFLPPSLPVTAPFEDGVYFGIQRSKKAPQAYDVWTAGLASGHLTLNGNPNPGVIESNDEDGHVIRPAPGDVLTVGPHSLYRGTPLRLRFVHIDPDDDERPLGPWLVPIEPHR
jgi:hypothetical protein